MNKKGTKNMNIVIHMYKNRIVRAKIIVKGQNSLQKNSTKKFNKIFEKIVLKTFRKPCLVSLFQISKFTAVVKNP